MARTPEAKSGVPWWAPLLALAALIAGVAAAAVVTQRDDGSPRQTHSVLGTQATLTDPVTTTAKPVARALSTLAGHSVAVRNARVTSVVGDRIFWIVRNGTRLLVHLQGPGTRYAIRRGQQLTFSGVVTRNAPHSADDWGLSWPEGRGRFRAQQVHLEVFGPRIRFG